MSKFPSYPFSVAAGQLVRERIWHPSQKIQELAESCIGMIPSTFIPAFPLGRACPHPRPSRAKEESSTTA